MPRLSVCSQRHVWTSAGDGNDTGLAACPVCGMEGKPAAVVLTGTASALETLSPAMVPPVVDDVTLVSAEARTVVEPDDGTAPTVPGYEVFRELGRGGMGVVYLARHRRLKRPVALKMILAGAHADPDTRARFRREAEAIARLQHPGIVQIHDVGEHQGRPFLALEYVEGKNLALQMAWGAMAPRTAAMLAERLARIVHHAHERGIVHRDLTPRNVLLAPSTPAHGICVPPSGQWFDPKITDFGLAKELDVDLGQTQTGVIIGTPSYMAPEQAQGRSREVGPATDVHAVGVILYELLTGRPPFLADTGHETLRQVVEHDPAPPTRLQSRVPRDLETICLKCLEKVPERRYATASDLADDLRRFLTSEPIRARPVSRRERAWKWVHRHPTATALLMVMAVSLLSLATGGVLYNSQLRSERDRAENNLELAMRAVDEMLSEVGEVQLSAEPRMEEKRRALLTKALALHREFMEQKSDDTGVRFGTAQAYRRMADVLRLLEQHDEALAAYDRAIALLEQLRADAPEDPNYRQQMAHCRNFQGEVHRAAGRHRDAEAAYRKASRIEGELVREFPNVPQYRQDFARTRYSLGIVLRESKRPVEAEQELRRSAELLTDLAEQFPENRSHRQHLARAFLNLGTVIRSPQRFAEAQSAYDRAISLLQPLTEKHPEQPDYRHELGVAQNNAGNLLSSAERLDDARSMHGKARTLFGTLAADFPKVPVYRQELANTFNSIGNVDFQQGKLEAAVSDWNEAVKLLEGLLEQRGDGTAYQGDLGMVLGNLGLAYHALARNSEASSHLQRAAERLELTLAATGKHLIYEEALRDTYQNLAEVLVVSGDHAAAATAARSLANTSISSAVDRYHSACFLARCVPLVKDDPKLDAEKRLALAGVYADESVAAIREALDNGFNDVQRITTDQDTVLAPVASRPDFQALVEQFAGKVTSASR